MSKDILYPLRRLHGWLVERKLKKKAAREFEKQLHRPDHTGVMVLGTPDHTNIGDSAIVLAELAFLRYCGVAEENLREVTTHEMRRFSREVLRLSEKEKLICWHGGGNMGNQWLREELLRRRYMEKVRAVPMVILPQTIYYTPEEKGQQEQKASVPVYNGREKLTIVAREKESFGILQKLYPDTKALLTPDIVLSATMETFGAQPQERNGVLLCMRSDAERAMTDDARQAVEQAVQAQGEDFRYTDMYAPGAVSKENRVECVRAKMEELASAKLVITDRLHGMVFAALTGTPCIAFGNYNHKVSGTYEWIQYLPYVRYAQSAEQAQEWIPELLEMDGQVYDNAPLMPCFEELARVVRKYAEN